MRNKYIALGLAGSLIVGSTISSWADPGVELSPDSKWQETKGRSAEGSFSKADQIVFNQTATQGRLEQLCHNLQLSGNLNVSLPSSEGGVTLGVLRRFVTLPNVNSPQDLELYQVDEYSPGANLTPTIDLARRTDAVLGLNLGVSFVLDSTVVRPREFYKNCGEIKQLLNVKDVRVVLPPSLLEHPSSDRFIETMTPRIAAMEDGELWSLSGVTTISAAPEIGAAVGHLSAGVTIGGTQNGNAVMMVHRLSRTHTRFSLRVSHMRVFNAAGTVAEIPIINIFNPNGKLTLKNALEKIFDGTVVGPLVDSLTASFSALVQIGDQSTQQYLIAFDLDPSDPAQAAELAAMMQYDFLQLLEKAVSTATLRATQKANLEHFARLTDKHEKVYERVAAVVQTDVGRIDQNHSVTVKLPVLGSRTRASSSSTDDVVTVGSNWANGPASRELHLASADRPKTDSGLTIPGINKTLISDTSDTKFTGFYFADNGKLQVVFAHLDAFQRRRAAAIQATLNEFRDMLSMAGSRGDPAADGKPEQYQVILAQKSGHIKDGSLAFTMSIGPEGIDKAFHASAEAIQKSVQRAFPLPNDESLAAKITDVLVRGRDATPQERNLALRNLIAQNGNSGVVADSLGSFFSFLPLPGGHDVAYEGTMKVLMQLADPQDISANLAMKLKTGAKREKGPGTNVSVNQNDSNTDLVDAGLANRERTLPPKYMDINQ